jgi:hypothetical protein
MNENMPGTNVTESHIIMQLAGLAPGERLVLVLRNQCVCICWFL